MGPAADPKSRLAGNQNIANFALVLIGMGVVAATLSALVSFSLGSRKQGQGSDLRLRLLIGRTHRSAGPLGWCVEIDARPQ